MTDSKNALLEVEFPLSEAFDQLKFVMFSSSFVMGIVLDGRDVQLYIELAVTPDFSFYSKPIDLAHCYVATEFSFPNVDLEAIGKEFRIVTDRDGTYTLDDLNTIEFYNDKVFVSAEFCDMTIRCDRMKVRFLHLIEEREL